MLSIAAMGSGQGQYYTDLAQEGYYTAGGEPPGRWLGTGIEALGLSGMVVPDVFHNIWMGLSSDGGRTLVQNAGRDDRSPGWDLTFSAPKPVSVLWSQAGAHVRSEIQEAHRQAVEKALTYLEKTAAFTRRGKGGAAREAVGLVVAAFEHGASRALDPQIHSHCLVLNIAPRRDGTVGSIESKPLYLHKMDAGALYRAELAAQLRERLGLIAVRNKTSFEIDGVPTTLCQAFSTRRAQIESALGAYGAVSARAAAVATLTTRRAKETVPLKQLLVRWQVMGKLHDFSQEQVQGLLARRPPARNAENDRTDALHAALTNLTSHQSYFSMKELVRALAEEAPPLGIGADEVCELATEFLASAHAIRIGQHSGENLFTTPDMLKMEDDLLSCAQRLHMCQRPTLQEQTIAQVLATRHALNAEQRAALRHIAGPGAIKIVTGLAGTGKTSLMEAARLCFEQEGYTVLGASLSAKAARGLEEGAGIPSATVHRTLYTLEHAASTREPNQGHAMRIDARTVLVLDEAAMVGTPQMARLLAAVERGGGQIICIGDARQLQAIECGGGFASLAARLGHADLKTVVRQREEWARQAVINLAQGDGKSALRAFAARGLLHVTESRAEAMGALIAEWERDGSNHPKDHLLLASTNQEVTTLNLLAQQARRAQGMLGERSVVLDGFTVFEHDRLLFTRNDRLRNLQNGALGTVVSIDPNTAALTVRMDAGDVVSFTVHGYRDIRLGYAVTTHKGQGMTVEVASVLLGGPMEDAEIAYVQASRARARTHLYVDRLEAGDELTNLVRQISTSHQKELAMDLLERQHQRLPLALQRR